ncbi:MAG: tetratricopeptide repeat protein, partial [Acutalibacteraceae bacterium]
EIDPQNGDNYFNLGNSYFFHDNYSKALELYAEAEVKGCSEEVKPKLYYQMAVLCSVKKDAKAALFNYQKYEDCTASTDQSNNVKVISQKIGLYLELGDLDKAENCAVQLKNMAPTEYKSYVAYFQILLAKKMYEKAEKLLDEILKYVTLTEDEAIDLQTNCAAIYILKADTGEDKDGYKKALDLLDDLKNKDGITKEQKNKVLLNIAEVSLKTEDFDKAILCAETILNTEKNTDAVSAPISDDDMVEEDFDYMAEQAIQEMDMRVENGEISDELGDYAETYCDDDGNLVRDYGDIFDNDIQETKAEEDTSVEKTAEVSDALKEKLKFILLSSYLSKEDYEKALKYSSVMKNSGNMYYSYFGIYSEAVCVKKLSEVLMKFNKDDAERKYAEAIAFFRSKMFSNPADHFAVVFRARLYAESGKFAKASEMANLLLPEEKSSVLQYIDQCRRENLGEK